MAGGSARNALRRQEPPLDADSDARRFIEFTESADFRSGTVGNPEEGMKRLKEAFNALDTNQDGKLGFDEVQGLLTRTMMQPDPSSRPGWAPAGSGVVGAIGADGRWAPRAGAAVGRESPGRTGFGGLREPGLGLPPGVGISVAGGYPVDQSSNLLNGDIGDDPWSAILAAGNEEFCVVPAVTLERLRAVGEAQLAEIEALRAEIGKTPEVKDETLRLEHQLEELEVNRVCAENELELRRLEAGKLAQEAAHLRQQRDALVGQVREAKARVEQLERWLEPSKQSGPPQSRADELLVVGNSPRNRAAEGGMKRGVPEAFY